MKASELKQIIMEELQKVLKEANSLLEKLQKEKETSLLTEEIISKGKEKAKEARQQAEQMNKLSLERSEEHTSELQSH